MSWFDKIDFHHKNAILSIVIYLPALPASTSDH